MIQRILSVIREISGWMKEMREEKKRERISLRGRIEDKQEIVNEYDRTHRYAARDNQRKRDENNLS